VSASVLRLRNTSAGMSYVIERIDDLNTTNAELLAQSWWSSRGTLALLVLVNGKEDSRFQRRYMILDRVPSDWPKPSRPIQVAPAPMISIGEELKAQPRPAPTLANPKLKPEARDSSAHVCWTCGSPLPPSRNYEGDNDPTPSGRLADMRCPECGGPQPGKSGRAIWNMYMTGQSRYSRANRRK